MEGHPITEIPASHRDLLDAPVGTLATIGPTGRPHQSPVWFLAEGDEIRLSLNTSRQKTKNLMRQPACSFLILDLANPYRYLEIRGTARHEADPDYTFANKVGAKYGGADLSARDQPGDKRVAVTIQAAKVIAMDLAS